MKQVIKGIHVDYTTMPANRATNDSKSLIEMTLDEYLETMNRKEELKAINAEKTLLNYHKKKEYVHSV